MAHAFFGVTSLGPQEVFRAPRHDALDLTFFEDDELEATFRKYDKDGSGGIDAKELKAMLEDVYHGPCPERELERFQARFDSNRDGIVSWDEFIVAAQAIREEVAQEKRDGGEFRSAGDLRATRRKHARSALNPNDTLARPVTTAQEHGFHQQTIRVDRFPRKACAETKYADVMVSHGVYM